MAKPVIRPMTPDDVEAADLVAFEAMHTALPDIGETPEERAQRAQARIAHLLATDPGGSWVAEERGRVVGLALALVREGLWGLSLFAVRPELQGRGIGRELLDAALRHGGAVRGWMILSSTDPRAMRRYARAGFKLLPTVAAAGIVERSALPPTPDDIRVASLDEIELTAEASRAVRGAAHVVDLPSALESDGRLLVCADRGFVLHRNGSPRLLAARDESTAQALLWAALAEAPRGATVQIDFMTAGQDWAIQVALEARLVLSTDGPLFARGKVGPLRPYLPSGPYL